VPSLKGSGKSAKTAAHSAETNEENSVDTNEFYNSVLKDNLTEVCAFYVF